MKASNPKIGMYGGEKPQLTLGDTEAKQPFGLVYGLGRDYYCVGDVFPVAGWETELAALRQEVTRQSKPKSNTKE